MSQEAEHSTISMRSCRWKTEAAKSGTDLKLVAKEQCKQWQVELQSSEPHLRAGKNQASSVAIRNQTVLPAVSHVNGVQLTHWPANPTPRLLGPWPSPSFFIPSLQFLPPFPNVPSCYSSLFRPAQARLFSFPAFLHDVSKYT